MNYKDNGYNQFLSKAVLPQEDTLADREINNFREYPVKFIRSGLADEKPVTGERIGSIYYESDTKRLKIWDGTAWISDQFPMGEISYFSTTGTAVAIASQSDGSTNMVKCVVSSTLSSDVFQFDNGGTNNGRLRYTGLVTKMCHCACTISIAPAGANDVFVFGVAKNGTVLSASKVLVQAINSAQPRSTAMHVMTNMATGDYLELYVGNTTDADDCTIKTLNLFALGM